MKIEKEHLFKDGERILIKVRKHWIVYVEDFLLHSFGCILFIICATYLSSRGVISLIGENSGAYSSMILITFVLIFWTSFFFAWTKNYFDVWYVTDKHIIAVNQKQMFDREEAFMELTRIQDVFFEREGFFSTYFGYGKLKVQSAGTEQEFIIDTIYDVEKVAHHIMELRDNAQGKSKQTVDNNQGL
jgi:hypothetical protein